MTIHVMAVEQLSIQDGYALFVKKSYETRLHQHYGIELVCCEDGTFNLSTEDKSYTGINTAVIPSNLPHRFQCGGAACQLLFLDPLSSLGQYVSNRYRLHQRKGILVNQSDVGSLFGKLQPISSSETMRLAEGVDVDFRIQNCLQEIYNNLNRSELSIKQLSEVSYLSESRLSHLFKAQLGTSIRQFVLWNKIKLAVLMAKDGCSLSTSAHIAGFTDSPHFTKVFANMFGTNPWHALKG